MGKTDEWYTPPYIIEALGQFELDPCAPVNRLYDTALEHYTVLDDGLLKDWGNRRVWLNPPYSRPAIGRFLKRMASNNNGIALLFNRLDTDLFQDIIFQYASGIFFIRGRIYFIDPTGKPGGRPNCGSVLVSFGEENAEILRTCNLKGYFFKIETNESKSTEGTIV